MNDKPPDAIWLPIIEGEDREYLGEWQFAGDEWDCVKYTRATPERETAGELLEACEVVLEDLELASGTDRQELILDAPIRILRETIARAKAGEKGA